MEAYHVLRSLLQQLNEQQFRRCLDAFMLYANTELPRSAEYFSPYCGHAQEWAYCHHIGIQANTNMYVKSFRNVMKSAYMQSKANRSTDSLISILFKIARDKAFERLIKVEKNSASKKVHDINKRHIMLLSHLPLVTDGRWMVPSESRCDQHYFIAAADVALMLTVSKMHC